jgi:hypothetical protein
VSQRSIVEINHDYSHRIVSQNVEFGRLLGYALGSGSNECWARLEPYGVRRAIQCHHSDDRHAVVNKRPFGFPGDGPPVTELTEHDMRFALERMGYRVTKRRRPPLPPKPEHATGKRDG